MGDEGYSMAGKGVENCRNSTYKFHSQLCSHHWQVDELLITFT